MRGHAAAQLHPPDRAHLRSELAGIVISHDQYDQYDLPALVRYPDKTVPFAVVRGLAPRVRAARFTDVVELDPWQSTTLGPVQVTAAPARHGVPEVTFLMRGAGTSVFFGADTLRIEELDQVPDHCPDLDLALLPINGLRIRPALNKQVVMDAVEAAELTAALRPRLAVPIHYAFTAGPIRDRLAPDTTVHVLGPGRPLTL